MENFIWSGIITAYLGFGMGFVLNPKDQWIAFFGLLFGFAQCGYGVYGLH